MRFLLAAVLALAACSKSSSDAPAPAASSAAAAKKDPAAARAMIAKGATVVDVRTPEEFAEAHLGSATNIPIDELPAKLDQVASLVGGDKDKPIVVYCSAGSRAKKAQQQLAAAGYTHVVNGGGYDDLK